MAEAFLSCSTIHIGIYDDESLVLPIHSCSFQEVSNKELITINAPASVLSKKWITGTLKFSKVSMREIYELFPDYEPEDVFDIGGLTLKIKHIYGDTVIYRTAENIFMAKEDGEPLEFRDLAYIDTIAFFCEEFSKPFPHFTDDVLWVKDESLIGKVKGFKLDYIVDSFGIVGSIVVDEYFYGNYIALGNLEVEYKNNMGSAIFYDIILFDDTGDEVIEKESIVKGFRYNFEAEKWKYFPETSYFI